MADICDFRDICTFLSQMKDVFTIVKNGVDLVLELHPSLQAESEMLKIAAMKNDSIPAQPDNINLMIPYPSIPQLKLQKHPVTISKVFSPSDFVIRFDKDYFQLAKDMK